MPSAFVNSWPEVSGKEAEEGAKEGRKEDLSLLRRPNADGSIVVLYVVCLYC